MPSNWWMEWVWYIDTIVYYELLYIYIYYIVYELCSAVKENEIFKASPTTQQPYNYSTKGSGSGEIQCSSRKIYVTPKTVETTALTHGCPP